MRASATTRSIFTIFITSSPRRVAAVNGDIMRHQGNYAFTYDANDQSTLADSGNDRLGRCWRCVFCDGGHSRRRRCKTAEYTASKYDVDIEPIYDSIFQLGSSAARKRPKRGIS